MTASNVETNLQTDFQALSIQVSASVYSFGVLDLKSVCFKCKLILMIFLDIARR